jgi:hypothetical protein
MKYLWESYIFSVLFYKENIRIVYINIQRNIIDKEDVPISLGNVGVCVWSTHIACLSTMLHSYKILPEKLIIWCFLHMLTISLCSFFPFYPISSSIHLFLKGKIKVLYYMQSRRNEIYCQQIRATS